MLPLLAIFFIFLVCSAFGIAILSYWKIFDEKIKLCIVGLFAGLGIFTTLTYKLQIFLPLTPILIISVLGIFVLFVSILVLKTDTFQFFKKSKIDIAAFFILCAVFLFSIFISSKLLVLKDDGMYTGIINAWGDVAWHASNITAFAEGQSVPPENPIFAGTRLTYPFMTNFFSAILLLISNNLVLSIVLPAVILIPCLLVTLYFFIQSMLEASNESTKKTAAVIGVILFLFGGATFGFTRFSSDFEISKKGFFEFITHLPQRDYSGVGTDEEGFHFLNPVTTLLLPQRSFLFGIPLALIILILLTSQQNRKKSLLVAGILTGILPLFHAHTIVALAVACAFLFLQRPKKEWLYFFVPATLLGIPEILYYVFGSLEGESFFRFQLGWMKGEKNFFVYWFQNTGFLIIAAITSLFLKAPKTTKMLCVSGIALFLFGNVFLTAPWEWDNFKLFVFFFLFILPAISWLLAKIFTNKKILFGELLVVIFIGLHTLSGILDIWKISLPTAPEWLLWDKESVIVAERIRLNTEKKQSILTAPIHNSPLAISGRFQYLGYAPHVWSHGGTPWNREKSIAKYYENTLKVLPEHMPNYVLIGPVEREKYHSLVIRDNWQLVFETAHYALYKIVR